MSYTVTKARIFQYVGLILIIGVFAGAYWYFQVFAGVKTNVLSPTGSLTSGLVGYWPFDRVSVIGTTSLDRSTSKYNGSLSGGPTVVSGRIGQAMDFDGSDDHMGLGSTGYLNVGATADTTITGWFYRDTATTNDIIVSKISGIGPGEKGYVVYLASDDYLNFKIGDGVQTYTVTALTTFVTPAWTHFAVVWDQDSAANTKIYINGQSVSTSTNGTISDIDDTSHTNTFRIGALNGGSEVFDGKIDEVRVYNRALTADEVLTLYNFTGTGSEVNTGASQAQGTGRLDSGLAGYWPLDDGSGTSATDNSTNGNTGTLSNGPTWTTGQIGGAVALDGVNDSIIKASVSLFTDKFTISIWAKMSATAGNDYIFDYRNGNSLVAFRASSNFNDIFVRDASSNTPGGGNVSPGFLYDNAWHMYTITADGAHIRAFRDGVQQGAASTWTNSIATGSNMTLGGSNIGGNDFLQGSIDEARVYDRGLSIDEVAQLYRLTSPTGTDTGLKGYWSFNGKDVSGTTAYDRSGAGNTGTLTNGPTVIPGKVGQALSFDGTNDYVTVPSATALNPASAITTSAWIKRGTTGTRQFILNKGGSSGASDHQYWLELTAANLVIFLIASNSTGYSVTSPTALTDTNGWHHIAGSYDGVTQKLYIDGVLVASASVSITLNTTTDNLAIGNRSTFNGIPYSGSIDEVRVFNRALSASEIQAQYAAGQSDEVNTGASQAQGGSRLDSDLVAYWPLDDGAGSTAVDASTNDFDGSANGGPTWVTGQIGGAAYFDGGARFTNSSTSAAVLNQTDGESFTLSAWFNRDTFTGDDTIIAKRTGQTVTSEGYIVYVDGTTDKLTFEVSDDVDEYQLESVSTFTTAGWNHFVVSWNDISGVVLYINGVAEVATVTGTFADINNLTSGAGIALGADSIAANFFNGSLDEIRIYNRSLSADEVAQLYRLNVPTGTDTGLKGYWSFNGKDVSGTTAYDRSGAGSTGTLTNGPTVTPGKLGQGLLFDGTNDYVEMNSTTTTYQYANTTFTVTGWFKKSGSSDGYIISQDVCNGGWGVRLNSGTLQFRLKSSGGCGGDAANRSSSTTNFNDGHWHHFAAVVTTDTVTSGNNDIVLYVDGVTNQGSISRNGSPYATVATNLRVGYTDGAGGYFNGSLDEVRVYNRALTATEVASLYNASK